MVVRALWRGLLLLVVSGLSMSAAANAGAMAPMGLHREAVDESRYPWSSVGKLYNESGSSCSGVVISSDRILTAAHCLFNFRTGRFIAANALHFLVGYRTGHYSAHVRIARYEIGPGFNPLQYNATSDADWAVLTATERLPADIEPLRLRRDLAPSGTKAVLVGYPQDRAFAMTADRDCELGRQIDDGKLMLHTCRGISGYSGAPILIGTGGHDVQIAGIQIASFRQDGSDKMLAVPAQSIWTQTGDDSGKTTTVATFAVPAPSVIASAAPAGEACHWAGSAEAALQPVDVDGLDFVPIAQDRINEDFVDIMSAMPTAAVSSGIHVKPWQWPTFETYVLAFQ